jgi:hypothetical protein
MKKTLLGLSNKNINKYASVFLCKIIVNKRVEVVKIILLTNRKLKLVSRFTLSKLVGIINSNDLKSTFRLRGGIY